MFNKKKNKKVFTPEMIEKVLLEKYKEIHNKTLDYFVSFLEEYTEKIDGEEKILLQAAPFFSAMSTVQYISMEMMRSVLIELLCDGKSEINKE